MLQRVCCGVSKKRFLKIERSMSGSEDEFSDELDEFEESAEEAKGTKKVRILFRGHPMFTFLNI
jgi:hypothetical protein